MSDDKAQYDVREYLKDAEASPSQLKQLQDSLDSVATALVKVSTRLALLGQAIGAEWNETAHEWQHAGGPSFASEEDELDFIELAEQALMERKAELEAHDGEATDVS